MAWPGASFIPVAHDPILTMIAQPWPHQQQFISPANAAAFQAASLTANQNYRMPHTLPVVNGHCANGQVQSGHGQSKQYDSQKQFGSLPQTNKRNKISITSKTNLYISGLCESDNDETVRELVKGIVDPKSCKAMMSDGKCKGSGFIDCATEEDAERAMQHILDVSSRTNKKLTVKYANENEKDNHNVYVRNLPKINFTNEDLQNLFSQYGTVTSVKLLESNGVYTGTGFVRFSTPEQALAAVEEMNQDKKVFKDCDRPVNCKLADKTDSRRRVRASPQSNTDQPCSNGLGAGNCTNGQHPLSLSHGAQPMSLLATQPVASVMAGNGYLPGSVVPTSNPSSNIQRRQSGANHSQQNPNQLQTGGSLAHFHSPQQQQQLISGLQSLNLNATGSANHSGFVHQAAAAVANHPAAPNANFTQQSQQAGNAPTPNQTSTNTAYFHPVQFASGVAAAHQNAQHAGYSAGVPGPGGLLYAGQPAHPAAAYQLLPYAHGHPFNFQYYPPAGHPSAPQQFST